MSENNEKSSFEHDFLKEVVTLVRKEFYKAGNTTDSDDLIERLLSKEEQDEVNPNDG